MIKIRTFILIIALALINACIDDSSSNCYIPTYIPTASYEVVGAGSNQYNGIYTADYETEANGKVVYVHDANSLYTIEYDSSDVWCIKDNGVLEYCMYPFFDDDFPDDNSILSFAVVHNGTSPGPTFEKITIPWLLKCGEL